ncbi:glycoside hydrolase family 3 N-terminal domain-containing protein [Prauserella muralis]|uniref:beta-N-acetylhexosaminidase n=1 Tax=Prauserella muralis TaxID=588067 RepID=A0A2V4B938_9PSEU|nr:glycoside hydrolase family 3 N-terminal domain-containing protein [Prauserella muralis]PXY31884.1 beta-glucosidase [Prauserella muralis]TWE13699.1 beta-N-acetylhexosaminidase [Prauserella muralis]
MNRLLLPIVLVFLLAACGSASERGSATVPGTAASKPPPTTSTAASSSEAPPTTGSADSAPDCAPVIAELSPRERVAQLLVVGVEPSDPAAATALVRQEQVGGIFIGGNATDLLTGNALDRLQQAARVPVSIAVDDEGGRVQRVDELDGELPSAREMAGTMTPEEVRALAEQRGRALLARGVTVNYAPTVDVTGEAADAAIGDRSFSADPAVARRYALAFATGLADAGVRPVLKHFPGHGHASGDSHTGLVTTPPLAELRKTDLRPYERIGEYGDVSVMVGHLTVPGLTGDQPASLSPRAYELLRTDYGFTGPVVTDDVGAMRAITDRYPLPDAVLRALQAGADQALWSSGGDVGPVLDRLEQAVAAGELPAQRVEESLRRVLLAKGACR